MFSSRIKRNASGDELVRRAVDAATAYENILNAIKAAEDAANKATSASESALQVGICTKGFCRWFPLIFSVMSCCYKSEFVI